MAGTDSQHRADYAADAVQRRSRWWIAALTFVVGVVVGVLTVGLLDRSTPDFSTASRERSVDDAVARRKPECARRGQRRSQCRLPTSDQRSPRRQRRS